MDDTKIIQIEQQHPLLGRHVRHDPRSRNFQASRATLTLPREDFRHRRHGRKLVQWIGSCTGHSAASVLNCEPLRMRQRGKPTKTNDDAMRYYSRATQLDPFPGSYPPQDTGSSGLAVCKAMQEFGDITSYDWCFGMEHGLMTLPGSALLMGSWWTWDMFNPDRKGLVKATGGKAGGHEYVIVGFDYSSRLNYGSNLVWCWTTWGDDFGVGGYFSMTVDTFNDLLEDDGDLISPVI